MVGVGIDSWKSEIGFFGGGIDSWKTYIGFFGGIETKLNTHPDAIQERPLSPTRIACNPSLA